MTVNSRHGQPYSPCSASRAAPPYPIKPAAAWEWGNFELHYYFHPISRTTSDFSLGSTGIIACIPVTISCLRNICVIGQCWHNCIITVFIWAAIVFPKGHTPLDHWLTHSLIDGRGETELAACAAQPCLACACAGAVETETSMAHVPLSRNRSMLELVKILIACLRSRRVVAELFSKFSSVFCFFL